MTRYSLRSPRILALVGAGVAAVTTFSLSPALASPAAPISLTRSPILVGPRTAATPTGSVLKIWAATNESPAPANEAAAVATATTHDFITAQPGAYGRYLAAMRVANPSVRVLAYVNGMFAGSTEGTKYPADWYSLDSRNAKIRSAGYGNYLMRPNSAGWVDNVVQTCKARLVQSGYDGCMVDMLGTAPLGVGYASGLPINPATNLVWTQAAWLQGTGGVAAAVRAGSGKYVIGNGLGNGSRYWSPLGPTSILLDGADAGISESWLRTSTSPLTKFPTETVWKQGVDALVDAGSKGKMNAVMVKLWGSEPRAEKDAWHKYALASFLLGTDGQAAFTATYVAGDAGDTNPWWLTNIGAPLGSYTKVGTAYVRTFAQGKVLVNPGLTAVTVDLGATYNLLAGGTASSVTLAPHTGEIAIA